MLRYRVGITLDEGMAGSVKLFNFVCRGDHIENPGQVMFAPGDCGKLGSPRIYLRREQNE